MKRKHLRHFNNDRVEVSHQEHILPIIPGGLTYGA